MALRLPPLSTLRLFEAAGRLQSFKLAAVELAVTPSAISKGVQSLEEWLGVSLFVRGTKRLTLTEAGEAYLPSIRQALAILAAASERVPGRPARRSLALQRRAAPSEAACCCRDWPASAGCTRTSASPSTPTTGRSTSRVMASTSPFAWAPATGRTWRRPVSSPEELVPVCSPDFLKSLGRIADLGARLRRGASHSSDKRLRRLGRVGCATAALAP